MGMLLCCVFLCTAFFFSTVFFCMSVLSVCSVFFCAVFFCAVFFCIWRSSVYTIRRSSLAHNKYKNEKISRNANIALVEGSLSGSEAPDEVRSLSLRFLVEGGWRLLLTV